VAFPPRPEGPGLHAAIPMNAFVFWPTADRERQSRLFAEQVVPAARESLSRPCRRLGPQDMRPCPLPVQSLLFICFLACSCLACGCSLSLTGRVAARAAHERAGARSLAE
jgi:hypothetical protein